VTSTIAVIAPGAMGAAVAARLVDNGARVLTLLDGRSEASRARAAQAGMTAASETEIVTADIVLSIVPPAQAEALAERLRPALFAAASKPLYIDCNAVNPDTVRRIAATVAAAGCPFADAGIIGGPPKPGGAGPRFYVSGSQAQPAERLSPLGLTIRNIGGEVGDASSLKMCYGAFNKGLIALGSAVALAAERNGVAAALHRELSESQAAMLGQLTRGVPDMFPKAYRWVAEFDEIAEFVGDRPERQIFAAIARLYAAMAAETAESREEVATLTDFFAAVPAKTR
jgi:3-hydroxyisobutyrate dehydrogenase-like beta-hydroxyacid dehydrogenase